MSSYTYLFAESMEQIFGLNAHHYPEISDQSFFTIPKPGTQNFSGFEGKTHTEETKALMSKQRRGKKRSEQTKQRMRKPKSDEHKENIRKSALIRSQSPEYIEKIRQAAILREQKRQLYTCPHCNIKTTIGNITRWHRDKCKKKREA